jgi:hypothetical protein
MLRDKVLTGIGICPVTSMRATGIPPHIAITAQLKKLSDQISAIQLTQEEHVTKLIRDIPMHLHDMLRQEFSINGINPVSLRDIDDRMNSLKDYLLQTFSNRNQSNISSSSDTHFNSSGDSISTHSWWKTWNWNDGYLCHYVFNNWKFPTKITLKQLWDYWLFGNRNEGIRPLRLFLNTEKDRRLQISAKCREYACKGIKLINKIIHIIQDGNMLPDGVTSIDELPIGDSDMVFEKAYKVLISQLYNTNDVYVCGRYELIAYTTLHNRLCRSEKYTKTGKLKRKYQQLSSDSDSDSETDSNNTDL